MKIKSGATIKVVRSPPDTYQLVLGATTIEMKSIEFLKLLLEMIRTRQKDKEDGNDNN